MPETEIVNEIIVTTDKLYPVVLAIVLSATGCRHSTEPMVPRNPREYAWSIDTISYPGTFQTSMVDIDGTSPSDVYIVGSNSDGMANMYHYDGKSWTPLITDFSATELFAIQAFAASDIWVVGARYYSGHDSSLMAHFDGSAWNQYRVTNGRYLNAIWGARGDDIWAAGGSGTVFHYNGNIWTKVPMDSRDRYYRLAGLSAQEVYLLGERQVGVTSSIADYFILQKYNGSNWLAVDSSSGPYEVFQFGPFQVAASFGTVYTLGYGVFTLHEHVWHQEMTTNAPLQGLFASNASNIFVVGQSSLIYHYDGTNWKQLANIVGDGWWLHAVWGTDTETFIVGHDASGRKSIVLHGK